MFNSRTFGITFTKHSATLGIDHIFRNGINHGLAFKIDTLNLVARILRGRIKRDCQVQTCVQTLAEQGETAFQCFLFHILFFLISSSSLCRAAI